MSKSTSLNSKMWLRRLLVIVLKQRTTLTPKMTCHPGRPVRCWVTSVEVWAAVTQRAAESSRGIPHSHREVCGLQAQLAEILWAGSPETWLLTSSQVLNSFVNSVKCHQGIRSFDYKKGKSRVITNWFQWRQEEHTEQEFKWKNCCPGGSDCVVYVHRVPKFCGNAREKTWLMGLHGCPIDGPLFDALCSLLLRYCSSLGLKLHCTC